ncbi:hypothetical protein QL818_20060, partial [Bacillus altitudinis]|uniref:hypothetical protein n=1 Tax=Bacillus altitudinis TaxID=293387 RepID=UPI0024A91B46
FLTDIAELPLLPICQVNILSDQERKKFLPDKQTFALSDQAPNLQALLENTVQQFPYLLYVTDVKMQLNYQDLNYKAKILAHLLIEK